MYFTHIYIEKDILKHSNTLNILQKFPKAIQVEIDSYKHIFNRPYQNFQAQKKLPRLILAKKYENFLYSGSYLTDQFKLPNFYYNSLVLNCLYNCEYCYLQGMYNSGHVVVFVNIKDFLEEAEKVWKEKGSLYLCISYDTDLLAFEKILGYCRTWIEFSRGKKNFLLEIRSKSSSFLEISDLEVSENVILAWSLSPLVVVKTYEKKTPTLKRRLENIKLAIEKGWKTRICLDPVLHISGWREIYSQFIEEIFQDLQPQAIHDLSLGTFRINADYLKKIRKIRTDSKIIFYPYKKNGSAFEYPEQVKKEMINFITNLLTKYISKEKIYI
jgi:spore photoproduct lyase